MQTDDMPSDGLHDSPGITFNMLINDTKSVRWEERVETGQAIINGVSIADLATSLELAREIVEARADRTVGLIKSAISGN